jgi:hypothetical protein
MEVAVRLIARLSGCLCLLGIGAVGLSAASAGAATLGSTHLDPAKTDFTVPCGSASCTFLQKRLPGAQLRAPFSGDIRKWRVVVPAGPHDCQLVVMHKKRNGKFKNVGQSSVVQANGPGVFKFPSSDLSIRKGDYIGINGDGVQGIERGKVLGLGFDPALEFPDAAKPHFTSTSEFQFNATVRH